MNLIHRDLPEGDRELFFGPLAPDDEFIAFDTQSIPHLLAELGVFPSVKQASNNGWSGKTLPSGYSELKVGKRRLYILNAF